MLGGQNEKKALMIVCDDKLISYANYLMGLIGSKDDNGDQIIGIEDGSVSAAIYSPQNYRDSLPSITSNNYILFIGDFKEAKDHMNGIQFHFMEHGMRYGWIGRRAVLFANPIELRMGQEYYDSFYNYSEKYDLHFEKLEISGYVAEMANLAKSGSPVKKALNIAKHTVPILAVKDTYSELKAQKIKQKIIEQQYTCLIKSFYLNGLKEFLEG